MTALSLILAAGAGALLPLALAPFDLWPLGILSCAVLAALLVKQSPAVVLARSFAYGLGLFGVGVSWVYESIHTYGQAPVPLALALTLLFCAFLAGIFALPWWLARRLLAFEAAPFLFLFPALWLLREWLFTWLLTGFPWLLVGNSHLDTVLAGWAPLVGVLGLGFISALTGVCLAQLALARHKRRLRRPLAIATALSLLLWLGGAALQSVSWTSDYGAPRQVAIVQGNISLFEKWDPRNHAAILQHYLALSEPLWADHDLILWPENAIPYLRFQIPQFFTTMAQRARATGTTWISGVLTYDAAEHKYLNSLVSKGPAEEGEYHKRRLVPFGEYVPLEDYLRGLIAFFDLPQSILQSGPWQQSPLHGAGGNIAPLICYEIAYPDLTARSARGSNWLLTVSNDAWFNDSLGPQQHLQLARMRALETQRPLLRGTNNGISAIVNKDGSLQQRGPQFAEAILTGSLQAVSGATPFMLLGSYPVVLLSLLLVLLAYLNHRRVHGRP